MPPIKGLLQKCGTTVPTFAYTKIRLVSTPSTFTSVEIGSGSYAHNNLWAFLLYRKVHKKMKKVTILNENRDFIRLYKRGKSQVSPVLVTYVMKNRYGTTRIGMTATKKVGCAVERNRCKRMIRAAFRELPIYADCGYDIVFVARAKTKTMKMQQIHHAMELHLSKLISLGGNIVEKQTSK